MLILLLSGCSRFVWLSTRARSRFRVWGLVGGTVLGQRLVIF